MTENPFFLGYLGLDLSAGQTVLSDSTRQTKVDVQSTSLGRVANLKPSFYTLFPQRVDSCILKTKPQGVKFS